MSYPETYKYTKEHEWVNVDGDTGMVGITDHAQHELGDIVFVEIPKTGTHLNKGDTLGSIESVKAVSDIYAPVSGEVIAVNQLLSQSPEKVNEDPHGTAWLVKLKLAAPEEINNLLSAADYQEYLGSE